MRTLLGAVPSARRIIFFQELGPLAAGHPFQVFQVLSLSAETIKQHRARGGLISLLSRVCGPGGRGRREEVLRDSRVHRGTTTKDDPQPRFQVHCPGSRLLSCCRNRSPGAQGKGVAECPRKCFLYRPDAKPSSPLGAPVSGHNISNYLHSPAGVIHHMSTPLPLASHGNPATGTFSLRSRGLKESLLFRF